MRMLSTSTRPPLPASEGFRPSPMAAASSTSGCSRMVDGTCATTRCGDGDPDMVRDEAKTTLVGLRGGVEMLLDPLGKLGGLMPMAICSDSLTPTTPLLV